MRSRQPLAYVVLFVPLVILVWYILASLTTQAGRGSGDAPPPDDNVALAYAAALQTWQPESTEPALGGTEVAQVYTPTPVVLPTQTATQVRPNPTHIVTYGDTLSRLAGQYGVRITDIALASNLTDINNLRIGQVLIIPLYGMTPTPELATLAVTPLVLLTSSPTPTPTETPSPPTSTPLPTETPVPSTNTPEQVAEVPTQPPDAEATAELAATEAPTAVPPLPTAVSLAPVGHSEINGVTPDQFIIMDDATRAHVREIFALGQQLGRNPRAFSKVGDSTIESPFFMDRFDEPGSYNLADYSWLQPAIDWYRGSFSRNSLAVTVGMHTWSVLDPMWADPYQCLGGEDVLECEVRVHNPSVIIFRLGVNDVGVPGYVEQSMRTIIEYSLENGIIPIIGTKGDQRDGEINNEIMRRLAAEYHVPLWDYDVLAATVPGRGLVADGAHMTTFYAHDWSQPLALQTGHGVHTLAGLMMLDAIYREVLADRAFYVPESTAEVTPEVTAEATEG
ncbi:MAG: LysM peptidoglycan-binding domain-containing protein [Anaerolineae bacterium]